jgi:hypothetical protein
MDKLTIRGSRLIDTSGREVMLRGVNLSGATKTPPDEPTHIANNFAHHRDVSFIGRPCPRDEAREHYERLRYWGFNVLRFLTTWEAVEHAGPGQYDTDYLDYLEEMVALAGEYGLYVFIDPHQDVWSRMTGGDGAPGWTLEAVGFDITRLDASEAAITMQHRYPNYPTMVWPTNASRLACATMFTLFFAGSLVAPGITINGLPVQDFLQNSFIRSIQQIARRVKDMPHVLGYGPLNEPGTGYLGIQDLNAQQPSLHQFEAFLTPADSILVGAGFPRTVPQLERRDLTYVPTDQTTAINPDGVSAWQGADIWQQLGVWGYNADGGPVIRQPDYFAATNFLRDGLIPFSKRYAQAMREEQPDAIIFLESNPSESTEFAIKPGELDAVVHAGHWYDSLMLLTKRFDGEQAYDRIEGRIVRGRSRIADIYKENIAALCAVSQRMGGVPTLIGEFGLAYDMNDQRAYQDGDFSLHELALSLYYDALDANLCHSTQWNYTPDNSNCWGDNWNQEDLSIFSRDQQANPLDIHSGGRAIKGFSRPYIRRAAGAITQMQFDHTSGVFSAAVKVDAGIDAPTLIYVPSIWYRAGYAVEADSGTCSPQDDNPHILAWRGADAGEQMITIRPKS